MTRPTISVTPSPRRRRIAGGVAALLVAALAASGPIPTHALSGRTTSKAAGPLANFKVKGNGVIRLAYKAFDPLKSGAPKVPAALRAALPRGKFGWWLVQLRYPIRRPARDAVLKLARRSAGYIPEATYVLEMTPEAADTARALRGVRWVGLYQPAYKLRPTLGGSPGVLAVAGRRELQALLWHGEDLATVLAQFRGIPGVKVDTLHATSNVVPFTAPREQLPAVAQLHGVRWVAEKPKNRLLNYNARWASDTGERDAFYATLPGNLNGAGQTAAGADTGINYVTDSNGNAQRAFADFYANGTTKLADYIQRIGGNAEEQMFGRTFENTHHRKMAAYYDLAGDGYEPSEASNHGTHTAGSVAADYPDAAGRYGTYNSPTMGADGIAPAAHFIMQDVAAGPDGGLGGLPADNYDLYEQVYDANPKTGATQTNEYSPALLANRIYSYDPEVDARTHNYSIGGIVPVVDAFSEGDSVDGFVHDHEDFVVVASASNDGPGVFTVPGGVQTAKNDLISCASANGRQPMVTLDSVAVFSSHGLTGDMRLKPDVCTPGQIVVSTKGGSSDEDQYLQGTSMSAPILTGLSTLVRQYFFDGFGPSPSNGSYAGYATGARNLSRRWNPSAALVKAVLINSAERMRGYYTGDDGQVRALDGQWPSAGQGWGRVELDNSLFFTNGTRRVFFADVWNKSAKALDFSSSDYSVAVKAGEPLAITLTWSDVPAAGGVAASPLVNNLDLSVTAPDGTSYVGNNFTTQSALPFNTPAGDPSAEIAESRPGPALADQKNNVEVVRIQAPVSGTYQIHIDGGEAASNQVGTAGGKQGYALAVAGLVGPGAKAPAPVVETVKPTISKVDITPVAGDLALATWETDEKTSGAVLLTDAAGETTRYADVYNPSTFPGLATPQNENEGDYVDKKAIGTHHEVRLTGLAAGSKYTAQIEATDLAAKPNTSISPPQSFTSTTAMFQPQANDIAQLTDKDTTYGYPQLSRDQQWGTSTQLYAGLIPQDSSDVPVVGPTGLPRTKMLPAFMFRLPAGVDPARITGAAVELTSAHDITNHFTQDARFRMSLLNSSVESSWGPGTGYSTVADAPVDAVVAPDTGERRGAGTKYLFSFACSDLGALKQNLAGDRSSGEERAAFRVESSMLEKATEVSESLFSFETGFGRRSRGPEFRPRLLLQIDGVDPQPCVNTPAPTIKDVRVQSGREAKPTSVVVSWRTDVPSSSIVLFRKAGTTAWTQTGTPFRSDLHIVEVKGLAPFAKYEFAVRSRSCNGLETTDDNSNHGYALFSEPYYTPTLDLIHADPAIDGKTVIRWVTDQESDGSIELGTSPSALGTTIREVDADGNGVPPSRTHVVNVSGLKPCTTYYFRAESANQSGLHGVSPILAIFSQSVTRHDLAPLETFDSGPGGFTVYTANAGTPPTEWALVDGAMRTTIAGVVPGYGSNAQTRLVSPVYKTIGGLLEVDFTETIHSEGGFDFGTLEYSSDDGHSWTPVRAVSGIGGVAADAIAALPSPIPEQLDGLDLVHAGNGSTLPRAVSVVIAGVPKGSVRLGWRMQSDGNTEIQPGWSVDDVLVKDFVPCPTHHSLTAEAPFTPKRTAVFSLVVPRVGPVPARAAKVILDADVVSSAVPAAIGNVAARRAGSAVCVSVAGIKISRTPIGSTRHPDQLPATGIGDGGSRAAMSIVAAMGLWLWRRRIA